MSAGKSPHHDECGIALITVMLVLTVVSVALVSMSTSRQMDSRRTENQLRSTQAWEYVYSVEAWAEKRLREDLSKNKHDSAADLWNKPLPATPIPEGKIAASIIELQGRLNLNSLIVDGLDSEESIQRMKRLFDYLDIKPELVDAILDWMDADMNIRYPHGAEDETYSTLQPPYRSANSSFSDVSELLRVHGMSFKDYEKLLPYIYVAESHELLNINTASSMVLRTLGDKISKNRAESLYRASGKPFEKVDDFLKDEAMSGISVNKISLSVISNHFLVSGQIDRGAKGLAFQSQLKRNQGDGKITLVRRMRRSSLDG